MSIVDKVKQMLGQHPDKARNTVDKSGDMIDRKTGGKHADKVDKAQDKAGDYIDRGGEGGQTGGTHGDGTPGGGQPS
ncbi:antitoxin [Actinomadura macra]|uniref:antitoxin n=1 Tax=Actinomadura macra TaxID=46164 RepID=UPI000833643F|nr:antitoxin [Actinomadura macra]